MAASVPCTDDPGNVLALAALFGSEEFHFKADDPGVTTTGTLYLDDVDQEQVDWLDTRARIPAATDENFAAIAEAAGSTEPSERHFEPDPESADGSTGWLVLHDVDQDTATAALAGGTREEAGSQPEAPVLTVEERLSKLEARMT